MSDTKNELTRPEKLARTSDGLLLHLAEHCEPGSDAHYDAIMEICNRGLHETEVGKTACSYLPELKIRLGQRTELAAFRAQVAEQLAGLLDWDLPDDPHGYADDYSEAVRKIATTLGLSLPT